MRRDGRDRRRRRGRDDAEECLLKAEGCAGAGRAGRFRGGGVRQPVPCHAQHSGDEEEQHDDPQRRVGRGCDAGGGEGERDSDPSQWTEAAAEPVRDPPGADPGGDGEHVDRREQSSGCVGRHVAVLVEEEDDEARDPDLRREVEAGACSEQPHPRVAERS